MEREPLWYKDAIIYQVHVRAFQDGNGDGRGDFRGLTSRLDYLADLGVTAVWLMPFYPSPLRDDGYDIADYTDIHPHFGTLADFKAFLDAAHDRGLKVITELPINHTSDQHAWFQRARHAPAGSPERDFYVWSDDPTKYAGVRIIFQDFEHSNWSWDAAAGAYFWHRFYSHQPDLNFDSPDVRAAITPVMDFWFDMGVDGMRLDAIPYLYEREGTNCESLPETHAFLKELRKHIDIHHPNRMLLAEANQWPEDTAPYFGDGDECHMAFHFPLMPRLYMALHAEDSFPILDILEQTPAIPDNCQWSIFLRNHDELTLEMVTDEERDTMRRAYAADPQARINLGIRRRLAPLMGNDRRKIELMNALLLSMPGTPVVYYGDEIGMGDNIYLGDRNGVRTPMQWSADRNAGFSRANPQKLFLPVIIDPEYHYEAVNADAQERNPSSLLNWTKRIIAQRKRYKAFGRGDLRPVPCRNPKILAFVRSYAGESVLVVANLSRTVQYAELDLAGFRGVAPREAFSRTPLPRVGDVPYLVTLGPHSFYWFEMSAPAPAATAGELPVVAVRREWTEAFLGTAPAIEKPLAALVGSDRPLGEVTLRHAGKLGELFLAWADAAFDDGETESHLFAIGFVDASRAEMLGESVKKLAEVRAGGERVGFLFDAANDPTFRDAAELAVRGGMRQPAGDGEIVGESFAALGAATQQVLARLISRPEVGVHPGVEVPRFLAERTTFRGFAPVVGELQFRGPTGERATVAILREDAPNLGTAWQHALDSLGRFYEKVTADDAEPPELPPDRFSGEAPDSVVGLMGGDLRDAETIGRLTAAYHTALSSRPDDPAFAPEPFDRHYQRSVYQTMRNVAGRAARDLEAHLATLPEESRTRAGVVIAREEAFLERFHVMLDQKFRSVRVRCHGDYHLGRLLYTGDDFVLVGLGGDANRPLSERRLKRSPLRDVASMVRSLHEAAFGPLSGADPVPGVFPGRVRPEDRPRLMRWARCWFEWSAAKFVAAYFAEAEAVAPSPDEARTLLPLFEAEQMLAETSRDLGRRPDRVAVHLTGLCQFLGAE